MSLSLKRAGALSLLVFFSTLLACTTSTTNTYNGGAVSGTDATAGADGSVTGGGGGGTTGDNSTNTATVAAKDDSGTTTQVDNSKPASKSDADDKKLGATSAGDVLTLFITDDKGTMLVVYINSKKHPLPAKAIPVGEPASDVYVTYSSPSGIFNSKDTGTIDIDVCPEKDGVAVVGKFNGVVVNNAAPIGPKNVTLNGTFNLVYFGAASALTCKPKDNGGGNNGGGNNGGGNNGGGGDKVDLGSFGKPTQATCSADPCDGGSNTTRNCCPHVPCIEKCWFNCATKAQSCLMECGFDMSCPDKCFAEVFTCQSQCLVTCEVGSACKTAMESLNKCEQTNGAACDSDNEDKTEACLFDKCCAEIKAAF